MATLASDTSDAVKKVDDNRRARRQAESLRRRNNTDIYNLEDSMEIDKEKWWEEEFAKCVELVRNSLQV